VAQIRQVIMNLITNASEAIGDEIGAIAVTTGAVECDSTDLASPYLTEKLEPGEYVRLEIADTGGGMDEEALNKLFDPFFTTKFMGRGLGLAATLGIIRGHNGAIKVDSEPGKGTTFRVLFPAHDKPAEMKTAGQAEVGPEEWRGVGVVLLVDDEETVRMVAGEMLEAMGFTVLTARDGAEAVKIFGERGGQIDLVLLDMSMPRMNGAEAFDQIRRLKPDARVILSSGFGVSEAMRRFDGKGLSGFIKKPYTYNALMEIVKEATGSR
jgi:CheY-like chemotaxis protein